MPGRVVTSLGVMRCCWDLAGIGKTAWGMESLLLNPGVIASPARGVYRKGGEAGESILDHAGETLSHDDRLRGTVVHCRYGECHHVE